MRLTLNCLRVFIGKMKCAGQDIYIVHQLKSIIRSVAMKNPQLFRYQQASLGGALPFIYAIKLPLCSLH